MSIRDVWESTSKTTKICVFVLAVLLVFGIMFAVRAFGAGEEEAEAVSESSSDYHMVEWEDEESSEPEVAVSYVSIDDDSMDVYFAQRMCENVTIEVTAVDDKGTAFKTASTTYHRGDSLSKLVVELPMSDVAFSFVSELKVKVDGAKCDTSRLAYFLDDAKRNRSMDLEAARLFAAEEERANARAEREAEAARQAEEEAARRAKEEEEARKKAEEEARKAAQPVEPEVVVPDGWYWDTDYYTAAIDFATTYGSSTSQFVFNDLRNKRLVLLEWDGGSWAPVLWCDVNSNGYADGFYEPGLFRVVDKAPLDGNGAYHADGDGHDNWMVVTSEYYVSEDLVEGGYHLRYFPESGYWKASGICGGYGGDIYGDTMTYVPMDTAIYLYEQLAFGSTVYNMG